MAIDQAQEWLSDPAGRYRFRLYADGHPTEWVSDGTSITEDPLPAVVSPGPTLEPTPTRSWAVAAPSDTAEAAPPVRPAGWYRSAANPDEVRYWDGTDWASPPADPSGEAAVTSPGGTHAPAPTAPERSTPGAAVAGAVPANWYPDPADRTRLRYWDGLGWTEQVLDERPTHP